MIDRSSQWSASRYEDVLRPFSITLGNCGIILLASADSSIFVKRPNSDTAVTNLFPRPCYHTALSIFLFAFVAMYFHCNVKFSGRYEVQRTLRFCRE